MRVKRAISVSFATLLLASVLSTQALSAEPPRRYVMIIAQNRSLDPGVAPLRYADDDGARYYELFKLTTNRVALFSVLDDETAAVFPEAARVARPAETGTIFDTLRRWNEEMAAQARAGAESELLFIYAGHGEVDSAGQGYVNLQDSKLRRQDLYQRILAPSRATYVHLIIDACKSYFLVKQRGGQWKDDSDPETHDQEVRAFLKREDLSSYPRAGVILATSGDHSTHEWARYRGGILSHELRSALTGSADINGDGRVEYSEAHAFVAAANARISHPEARLNVFVQPPHVNRHQPLMDLRQAAGARLLRFDSGVMGQFHLEDDRGLRYADLHKSPEVRFDMLVDRNRSYFVFRDGKEARVGAGTDRVRVAGLSFGATALASRGSLDQTFRRDLYQVAYSRGFYDGFCARTGLPPVEGGPTEFVISGTSDAAEARPPVHSLSLGYLATNALLDLHEPSHGISLRYDYALHRNVTLNGTVEYGRAGASSIEGGVFSVHRLAALVGATGRLWLLSWLAARAEVALGYQAHFGSGTVYLLRREVEGSDPLGLRMEAGLGAQINISPILFGDLRGGLALQLVTVESERHTDTGAYGAAALGARF